MKAVRLLFPLISPFILVFATLVSISLETKAAMLLVYNNNDTGAGSLRQAIADNRALGGGSTVIISNTVSGTITLASSELRITNDITIQGPGAKVLVLSGANSHSVFSLDNANVQISGLTIAYGSTNFNGGGIYMSSGSLVLNGCDVVTNLSKNIGGGIYAAGTLVATNCNFSYNLASGQFLGQGVAGGVYGGGNFILVNCAFVGNLASFECGGLRFGSGNCQLINSTFYGNSGALYGGAIENFGTLRLLSCTISSNRVNFFGGGITNGGTCFITNTIVARNTNSGGSSWDCAGAYISGGYNLIGAANGSSGFAALGDQAGTTNSPINPLLQAPAANGGPTLNMRPLPGSPAIDQGKSFGLATDQRGRARPSDKPGVPNATGGDGTDIGAFEDSSATLIVTNNNDSGPGSLRQLIADASPTEGDVIQFASNVTGSIKLTNGLLGISKDLSISGPGARVLSIDGRTNTQIIEVLAGNVSISGLTIANGRTVGSSGATGQDGAQGRGGGVFNQSTLYVNDCIFSNNVVVGGAGGPGGADYAGNGGNGLGGAIANIATLNVSNCYFINNAARGGAGGSASAGFEGMGGQGYGGAVYSFDQLTLSGCTLATNIAAAGNGLGGVGSGSGGGFYNDGTALIVNSTIASNSAAGSSFDFGGGIYDNGVSLMIRCSTIASNQADYGGGIYTGGADVGGTILAGNLAASGPNGSGSINSSDYNLIQSTNSLSFITAGAHDLLGVDPLLGPLQDNGGLSPTMALPLNSPALDHGKSFGLTNDQRGVPRPFDFDSVNNATGGDASDIGAFELARPPLSISAIPSGVLLTWPWAYGPLQIEATTNLVPANNNWAVVAGSAALQGNRYFFTNSPATGSKYFRSKLN